MSVLSLSQHRNVIVQANTLVEASLSLNINQQALFYCALSLVDSREPITDQKMYVVTADQYADFGGIDDPKNAYIEMKKAARSLLGKVFYVDMEKLKHRTLIQSANYVDGKGYVEIRFSHDIIPYISDLRECFTLCLTQDAKGFKSRYGRQLFLLLMQFKHQGERYVDIPSMRYMWGIEDKYPEIWNLKSRVIDPAIKDINTNSSWDVKYEQKKNGRKVVGFNFIYGRKLLSEDILETSLPDSLVGRFSTPHEEPKETRKKILQWCNDGSIVMRFKEKNGSSWPKEWNYLLN